MTPATTVSSARIFFPPTSSATRICPDQMYRGGAAMLHVLGSRTRLCDGINRREALRAGGLAFAGLTLPHLLALEESAPAASTRVKGFGKAKSCILLYLYGSPSQLET